MIPATDAVRWWEALRAAGFVPCGLGARFLFFYFYPKN